MQGTGVTAWGSIPCEGKTINAHYIAVDPDVISYGSVVYIKFSGDFSYLSGEYVAVDTGGAIVGNRLDLYAGMGTVPGVYDFCMKFGRRNAIVYSTGKKITVEQAERWRNPM